MLGNSLSRFSARFVKRGRPFTSFLRGNSVLIATCSTKSAHSRGYRAALAAAVGIGASSVLLSRESQAETKEDANCSLKLPVNFDELVRARHAMITAHLQRDLPRFRAEKLPTAPFVGQCYHVDQDAVSHSIDHTLLKPQASKAEISKLLQVMWWCMMPMELMLAM
jgi:hypothetical protein